MRYSYIHNLLATAIAVASAAGTRIGLEVEVCSRSAAAGERCKGKLPTIVTVAAIVSSASRRSRNTSRYLGSLIKAECVSVDAAAPLALCAACAGQTISIEKCKHIFCPPLLHSPAKPLRLNLISFKEHF